MNVTWNTDHTVSIDPPKRPRKITGTRFAAILGQNRWESPFATWCEITGAHRVPFEDTVYTLAGKAIEPKQIAYLREAYGMDDLVAPVDVYGPDPFSKTYGNFFHDAVFGGMWDALLGDPEHPDAVIEFKTTKRSEDWVLKDAKGRPVLKDGAPVIEPPEYYSLQAALYAWLLDCDDVVMVVSFLKETDYDDPEAFVPTAANTATCEFSLSERYPDFEHRFIDRASAWWRDHVLTGDSPAYDEARDAEYLKALRTCSLNPTSNIEAMLDELDALNRQMELMKPVEKRVDEIKKQLKQYALERIRPGMDLYTLETERVHCMLRRGKRTEIDRKAMEFDGVLDRYLVEKDTETFTVKFD